MSRFIRTHLPEDQDFIGALYNALVDALPDDWTEENVRQAVETAFRHSKTSLHDDDPIGRQQYEWDCCADAMSY